MRAGGRTRRRAVDALVALVVIALVVAVLARARSNDPRRDETRRKSEPRRAGGFERGGEGGGGDGAARRRAGTTETGMAPGDGKRTVGARGARSGDADARVREPRGGGVRAQKQKTRRVGRARGARRDACGARLDGHRFLERAGADVGGRETRRRRPRDLEKVPLPVRRSERRRLADPGGDGDGDGGGDGAESPSIIGSENAFSGAVAIGPGESCAAACGLCRASCCCDAECRAVGDCCADFEQPGMCVEQKTLTENSLGNESGQESGAPPTPESSSPGDEIVPPPDGFGLGEGTVPGASVAPPAAPEISLTWPPAPVSSPLPVSPPPPPPPSPPPPAWSPSAPVAAAGTAGPPLSSSGPDAGDDAAAAAAAAAAVIDARGTWHSDVRPPPPWNPSLPPAPFPPLPGVPPFPLGVYAKLQAVPRCSPFCDTRAPPPSLPRGDRKWPLLVAAAAEKQWAQIKDLAQIQIGASVGGEDHEALLSNHARGVEGVAAESAAAAAEGGWDRFGAGTTEDAFGPFFATGGGSELKRHARRVSSVENTAISFLGDRERKGDAVERETALMAR